MLNLAKINKEKKDTKTNRVSKYTISVQKLCYSQHEYKGSNKKILSHHYFIHAFKK